MCNTNQNTIIISIVIPCYQASRWLDKLMDSILSQVLYESIQIILVNDGSVDNTWSILQSYASMYDFITIINQQNSGPAVARNNGLRMATGRYVWFVDADDMIAPNSLNILLKEIEKNPTDVICFNYQDIDMADANLNERHEHGYIYDEVSDGLTAYSKTIIPAYLWNRIIRRDLLFNNNITFSIIPEDEDFLFHTYFVSHTFRFISNVIYRYRQMDVSFGKNINSHIKYYNGYLKIIEKYVSLFGSVNCASFWNSLAFSCIKNVLINYNKIEIMDSSKNTDSRNVMYKKIRGHCKLLQEKISFRQKRGIILWGMMNFTFIFDYLVFLKFRIQYGFIKLSRK